MAEWNSWAKVAPPDPDAFVEWMRYREGFDAYVHKGRAREVAAILEAHGASGAAIFWRPAPATVVGIR